MSEPFSAVMLTFLSLGVIKFVHDSLNNLADAHVRRIEKRSQQGI